MTVTLTLGPFTFTEFEIPERINFGGDQSLALKQLVGGQRTIDAMGRVDDDISWSGLLFGDTASPRAHFLDQMRVQAAPLILNFFDFSFLVVVRSFKPSFERFYQIPYTITVTVIQDLTKPFPLIAAENYDEVINEQLATANALTTEVGIPSVSSAMANVNRALSLIPSLTNATLSQASMALIPVNDARVIVQQQIKLLSGATFS